MGHLLDLLSLCAPLFLRISERIALGRHLCRTKLPRKVLNSKTKSGTNSETKSSQTTPKHPRRIESLVQPPKTFHQHFFTALRPQFQTQFQAFFKTRICRHGHAEKALPQPFQGPYVYHQHRADLTNPCWPALVETVSFRHGGGQGASSKKESQFAPSSKVVSVDRVAAPQQNGSFGECAFAALQRSRHLHFPPFQV